MLFVMLKAIAQEHSPDIRLTAVMGFVTEFPMAVAVEAPDVWNPSIYANLGRQVADVFIFKKFLLDTLRAVFPLFLFLNLLGKSAYLKNISNDL